MVQEWFSDTMPVPKFIIYSMHTGAEIKNSNFDY